MAGPTVPPRGVVRAALAARMRLMRAADRMLPAQAVALQHATSFATTRMMGAVAELRIADELVAGPATAAELAERLDLDADAVHRVLRALAVPGFFRLDRRGRFTLTRSGEMLVRDAPTGMTSWVRYLNLPSTQAAWAGVTDTLRTGQPSFPAVHGTSVWSWFAEHPEEEQLFAATMRRLTEINLPFVIAGYPWPEHGTVCDVAGGVGTLLAEVLRARPGLRGVLVDAPGVLAEADGHLTRAGVRERVELAAGDIFARVEARADVYVLKDILHDWDDERSARILATVRAAMAPGARLVLVEILQERNAVDPLAGFPDVHMMTQCDGGRQRSLGELHALLRGAGLRPGTSHDTGAVGLVEAIAP